MTYKYEVKDAANNTISNVLICNTSIDLVSYFVCFIIKNTYELKNGNV